MVRKSKSKQRPENCLICGDKSIGINFNGKNLFDGKDLQSDKINTNLVFNFSSAQLYELSCFFPSKCLSRRGK